MGSGELKGSEPLTLKSLESLLSPPETRPERIQDEGTGRRWGEIDVSSSSLQSVSVPGHSEDNSQERQLPLYERFEVKGVTTSSLICVHSECPYIVKPTKIDGALSFKMDFY